MPVAADGKFTYKCFWANGTGAVCVWRDELVGADPVDADKGLSMNEQGMNRFLCFIGIMVLSLVLAAGTPSPVWGQTAVIEIAQFTGDMDADAEVDEEDVNDPLEPLNRVFFQFNEFFHIMLLRPASIFYREFFPPPLREVISNVLDNLNTPVILVNDILQGQPKRAFDTTSRFFINSTVGLGGTIDVAAKMGIEEHDEDFGQTLAVWGLGEGFYLVLPFFGPSSPRDAIGKHVVDGYLDAFGMYFDNIDYEEANHSRKAFDAVEEYGGVMDELDQIKKTSIDYYAAIRSMYRQKREAEIRNGEDAELPAIPYPDLTFEFDDKEFEEPPDQQTKYGIQNLKPEQLSQF